MVQAQREGIQHQFSSRNHTWAAASDPTRVCLLRQLRIDQRLVNRRIEYRNDVAINLHTIGDQDLDLQKSNGKRKIVLVFPFPLGP